MIKSLRLHNFKCFADQEIGLGPLTLLSGLNGTGKSSILQALLLLRQSFLQGVLPQGGLALNGDLVQTGTARDALYEGSEDERIRLEIQSDEAGNATWEFPYDRGVDVLDAASAPVPENVFKLNLFGTSFQYLCAERIGPRTSFPMSDLSVRHQRQLGIRGEFTSQFLTVYGSQRIFLTQLAHPQAVSPALKDQVEAWLGEVSPGTRLQVTQYSGMDLVQLQYSFVSGRDVSSFYRPTNVGFGITFVLPLLVAALASEPGALLLLENPEAHLHPRGQVAMGGFLALAAAAGAQIVIETHSDHILNGVRLAVHRGDLSPESVKIHFFSRSQEADRARHLVTSPILDRNGRLDTWPEDFFDLWDKSLEALLLPPGS